MKPGRKPIGRWSIERDMCARCGSADRPHRGHGLCVNCWMAGKRGGQRRADHPPARSAEERRVAARAATARYRERKRKRDLAATRPAPPAPYRALVWPGNIKPLWRLASEGRGCRVCGGDLLLDGDGDYACLMCGRSEQRALDREAREW